MICSPTDNLAKKMWTGPSPLVAILVLACIETHCCWQKESQFVSYVGLLWSLADNPANNPDWTSPAGGIGPSQGANATLLQLRNPSTRMIGPPTMYSTLLSWKPFFFGWFHPPVELYGCLLKLSPRNQIRLQAWNLKLCFLVKQQQQNETFELGEKKNIFLWITCCVAPPLQWRVAPNKL